MKCYVLFYTLVVLIFKLPRCDNAINKTNNLESKCGVQENSISVSDFPWVALIRLLTRTYNPDANVRCVGVLINERYIITSSTCLQFLIKDVILGESEIGVDSWRTHDKVDIALLKLSHGVNFTDYIQPVCLPFDEFNNYEKKTTLYTAGWGASSSEIKIVKSRMVECEDLSKHTICLDHVGKNTVCTGDEGAPVMYMNNDRWVLHGIVSSTFDKDGSPCAVNSPSTAIPITDDVLEWIVDHSKL